MKKRNVPKEERETILFFNDADDIATIYTVNTDLNRRLAKFADNHPDLCKLMIDDKEYGNVIYEIKKSRAFIRLTAPYRDERRRAASEYAKKNRTTRENKRN